MYFKVNRTKPAYKNNCVYLDENNKQIGSGKLEKFSKNESVYQSNFNGNICNVTVFNNRAKTKAGANPNIRTTNVASFSINEGSNIDLIWCFSDSAKKKSSPFSNGKLVYNWWKFIINNDDFEMYRVGLKKNGYYFQIRKNGKVIATIDKKILVKNYCDTFEVYLLEEKDASIIVSLLVYINLAFFNHYGESTIFDLSRIKFFTESPETLSKFDADFISLIKNKSNL